MIVINFHVVCVAIDEAKANSPLIINGNGVLALSIASQRMQPISGRNIEIIQSGS